MGTTSFENNLLSRRVRIGCLVRAFACQGVVNVGNGDDAASQRDLMPGEPARIAASVPALVVCGGDVARDLKKARFGKTLESRIEGVGAQNGVPFHYLEFARRQLPRLE